MKNAGYFFALMLLVGGAFSSCSDDVYTPDPPRISFPSTGFPNTIGFGEQFEYTFIVEAPRGYQSHGIFAVGGVTSENSSAIPEGERNFNISGTYTAGTVPIGGAITITVTDREGNSANETISIQVVE